eukprot:CFRG2955T1
MWGMYIRDKEDTITTETLITSAYQPMIGAEQLKKLRLGFSVTEGPYVTDSFTQLYNLPSIPKIEDPK